MNIKDQVVDYLRVLAWKIQEKKLSSKDDEGGAITVVMSESEGEDTLDEAVLAEILAEEDTGADDSETNLETNTEDEETTNQDEESQDPFKLDLEVSDEEVAEEILSQLGHSSDEDVAIEDDEAETIAEQAISQSIAESEEVEQLVIVRRPLDRDYFFIPEIFISLTSGKSGLIANKTSKKMRNKWSTEEFPFLTLTIHDLGGGLAGISPKEKY